MGYQGQTEFQRHLSISTHYVVTRVPHKLYGEVPASDSTPTAYAHRYVHVQYVIESSSTLQM